MRNRLIRQATLVLALGFVVLIAATAGVAGMAQEERPCHACWHACPAKRDQADEICQKQCGEGWVSWGHCADDLPCVGGEHHVWMCTRETIEAHQ